MGTALSRVALRYFAFWLGIGWLLIAAVLYASFAPIAVATMVPHNDKLGHLIAYFALAWWFSQLYDRRVHRWWAIAFIGMGVLVECVQGLIASRVFELADIAANTVGVVSGWALGYMVGGNCLARFELWLESHRD